MIVLNAPQHRLISFILCYYSWQWCGTVQHAIDAGWLMSPEGKPKLVALVSSAWEASLGVAHLHQEGVIHGGLTPATCFLKAARNQRGFVVKVAAPSSLAYLLLTPVSSWSS